MIKYEEYECRSILNRSVPTETDPFVGTVNPYTGCEHGCKYCYVQAEKYLPYENIDEFYYTIRAKKNAAALLFRALERSRRGVICLGSSTDPYQPAEEKFGVTHEILKVIDLLGFGLHIFTKSDLILRDMELLERIAGKNFLGISFSLVTMDKEKAAFFEPGAPAPEKRLFAMNEFARRGIRVGVAMMPILPFITDSGEGLEDVFSCARDSGMQYLWSSGLTLRDQQRRRFIGIINQKYPELAAKYEELYGSKASPNSEYSSAVGMKISALRGKYRIDYRLNPGHKEYGHRQYEFAFT